MITCKVCLRSSPFGTVDGLCSECVASRSVGCVPHGCERPLTDAEVKSTDAMLQVIAQLKRGRDAAIADRNMMIDVLASVSLALGIDMQALVEDPSLATAERNALVGLLRQHEWDGYLYRQNRQETEFGLCPHCLGRNPSHEPGCDWASAIARRKP